ncbi:MAG: MCP four helix bundle domain-containing protein [Ignavibacteria bacterium]|jgi:signal transduction histidine kinase
MKLSNQNLRTKQLIGFGAILIMLILVYFYSIKRMSDLNEEINAVSNNWLPRAVALSELNINTLSLRISQFEHAYTFDEKKMRQQELEMIELIDHITENIDTYEKLKTEFEAKKIYSEAEKNLYELFTNNWEIYQDLSFQFFKLSRENKKQEAIDLLNNEAKEAALIGGGALEQLVNLSQQESFDAAQRAEKTFSQAKGFTTLITAGAIVLSIFIAGALVNMILRPIAQLQRAAGHIAKGDYDIYVDIENKDEIGELSDSFINMAHSLKDAQNKLVQSEKMASLGQLTAGVAHEINNPVNFVLSNVNPLKRDIKDIIGIQKKYEELIKSNNLEKHFREIEKLKNKLDYDYTLDEIDELLDGIEEGGNRTAEIVKGLRNFSRLDEEEKKIANINECINSTLMMLKNQFKNRIEIEKEFEDIPDILCYPGKLNQVFMNLLINAGQAISTNGKIKIKTWNNEGNIFVSIKDNGKGMDEKTKSKIFEPFFTTKDVGEGTGLGLSISYGIIQDHDGKIDVKSIINKGTEFIITLPNKQ